MPEGCAHVTILFHRWVEEQAALFLLDGKDGVKRKPVSSKDPLSVQMATILFYLSDVEEGGETVFLLEGEDGMERKPSIDYKSCDVGYKVPPSTSFPKGPLNCPGPGGVQCQPQLPVLRCWVGGEWGDTVLNNFLHYSGDGTTDCRVDRIGTLAGACDWSRGRRESSKLSMSIDLCPSPFPFG